VAGMPEIGLDLGRYLAAIADARYAIVKVPSHFPALNLGEDLDILAPGKESVVQPLLAAAAPDVEAGCVARVGYDPAGAYVHLDILKDDVLQLRFDVASRLASFGSYRIAPGYAERIVGSASRREVRIGERLVVVRTAAEIDELVIRYLEYHELFSARPDEIKHLEYVLRAVEDHAARERFLDRLHENISLPRHPAVPAQRPWIGLSASIARGRSSAGRWHRRLERRARQGLLQLWARLL
jgi:hypothetical protein